MSSRAVGPLVFACGVLLGLGGGWLLAATGTDGTVRELETALAQERERATRASQDVERLEARLEARAKGGRKGKRPAGEPSSTGGGTLPEAGEAAAPAAAGPVEAVPAAVDAARRAGRVAELSGRVDELFEQGDGKAALSLLKELAALVPEGRTAAMDLAVRMNEDVNGGGALKLSQMVFYGQLGDPAVRGLMQWSLENPSKPDFRVLSAWSLPWTQPAAETTARFAKALEAETEYGVQEALIVNLARLRQTESDQALAALLADAGQGSFLRARVATELATSEDPEIVAAIEQAAYGDPDPEVQAAAAAALVVKNPPATGYLVTGTTPESPGAAAGFRAGDILLRYGKTAITTDWGLYQATRRVAGDQPVKVVVLRNGGEVELLVEPGRLGVYGRAVQSENSE